MNHQLFLQFKTHFKTIDWVIIILLFLLFCIKHIYKCLQKSIFDLFSLKNICFLGSHKPNSKFTQILKHYRDKQIQMYPNKEFHSFSVSLENILILGIECQTDVWVEFEVSYLPASFCFFKNSLSLPDALTISAMSVLFISVLIHVVAA